MTVKTILACLSSETHAKDVLTLAAPLARQHGAHLIGLRTPEDLAVYPSVAVYVPDSIEVEFLASQKRQTEALQAQFAKAVEGEGIDFDFRVFEPPLPVSDRMAEAAHTADLVVMAQDPRTDDAPDFEAIEEDVIRRAGRPVLMVPRGYGGDGIIGKTVVIGWSPTREAARAVHEAIPLMTPGAAITLVTVGKQSERRAQSASDAAAMLARHGFEVELADRQAEDGSIAETLKQEALQRGADLMVTGAFGHSRLYDFIIGAVTVDLMRTAQIPVLFSR